MEHYNKEKNEEMKNDAKKKIIKSLKNDRPKL